MPTHIQLTAQDLVQAQQETFRKGLLKRTLKSLSIMTAAVIVGVVAMAALRGKTASVATGLIRSWPDFLMLIGLLVTFLSSLSYWWFIPAGAKRQFAQTKLLQIPRELSVEKDGLRFRDEFGDSLTPWDHIQTWRETRELLLIHLSNTHFYVLPKRSFSDPAELDVLKSSLSSRVSA